MKTYTFKKKKIRIEKCAYPNGRTALEFICTEDGTLLLVATVNLPHVHLFPRELFIGSENEGVLEFLIAEGIVSKPKQTFPVGRFGTPIYVVDLLNEDP